MGPGIQGNQLRLEEPTLYVFSIIRSSDHLPLEYAVVAENARAIGADVVPLAGWGGYNDGVVSLASMEDCQALADEQKLPDGSPAEGIVVRISPPRLFGNGRPAGFKIINRNYKDTD